MKTLQLFAAVAVALLGSRLAAAPVGSTEDATRIEQTDTVFKELPVSIRVRQRSTTAVAGSSGALSLTADDITGGQVMVTLTGKNHAALLGPLSMKPGDSARFQLGEARYVLKLVRLDNALIGDDFATFVIDAAKRNELTDAEKIQRLIRTVETSSAVFIRNGTEYSAAEAAKHLRTKHDAAKGVELTASQFIEQIASRSSITGDEYTIRFPDGSSLTAGAFLRAELAKLEQGDGNTPAPSAAEKPQRDLEPQAP